MKNPLAFSCPLPIEQYPHVVLAHGGGGKLMNDLIQKMFLSAFDSSEPPHDSVVLPSKTEKLAFTTDGYVVHPLFFPGGNIGSLAIHGTVNDLAMSGATPRYVSASFIIEEGLPMADLWKIVSTMAEAASQCGVKVVTGDTKVVDRGKGDGIFITTSGIGTIEHTLSIGPSSVRTGDAILCSGDLGRHGIAVLSAREGLEFGTAIESDSAPLHEVVSVLLQNKVEIHCMRDLTRGGLASALNEIADAVQLGMDLLEEQISVRAEVRSACDILGFDPLYVANEGRFCLFLPADQAAKALEILRSFTTSGNASRVGTVSAKKGSSVVLRTTFGTERIVDMLSGEQLPRIC